MRVYYYSVLETCTQLDIETSKIQEKSKIQEIQQQFKRTESSLLMECEAAKKAAAVSIVKEVPVIDSTLMDELSAENEKLKVKKKNNYNYEWNIIILNSLYRFRLTITITVYVDLNYPVFIIYMYMCK